MRRRYPPLQCDHCGRFIGRPFDAYTNYGSVIDLEPPDPTLLCERCHWADLIWTVEWGRRQTTWIDSAANRLAGSIIRHLKRHPGHRDAIIADLRARAAA